MNNISKGTVEHMQETHLEPAAPSKVISSVKGPQPEPGKGKYPIGYTPSASELARDKEVHLQKSETDLKGGVDKRSTPEVKNAPEPDGKPGQRVKAPPVVPKLIGTVSIEMYENIPYKVEFTEVTKGCVGASHITMAWRHMLKAYRVWKGKDAMREFASGNAEEIACQSVNCENTLGPGKHKKFHNKWLCPSCIAKDSRLM